MKIGIFDYLLAAFRVCSISRLVYRILDRSGFSILEGPRKAYFICRGVRYEYVTIRAGGWILSPILLLSALRKFLQGISNKDFTVVFRINPHADGFRYMRCRLVVVPSYIAVDGLIEDPYAAGPDVKFPD